MLPRARSMARAVAIALATVLLVAGVATPAGAAATTTISGVVSFGSAGSHPTGLTARVTVKDAWMSTLATATTNAAGAYSVAVPQNSYVVLEFTPLQYGWQPQVYRDDAVPYTLIPVGTTALTNLNQTLPPLGSISGHVSIASPTVPAINRQVRVSWTVCARGICDPVGGDTYTNSNGDYSLSGLRNGTYTLVFWPQIMTPSFNPLDRRYEPVTTQVVVSSQQPAVTQDATVPLRRIVSISGTVYLDSTATPAGAGDVTVHYEGGGLAVPTSGTVTTDADGRYVIPNIPYDRYSLRFDYNGTAYADEWWNDYYTDRPYASVDAGLSPTGIDAVLAPSSAIAGSVTNSSGTGLPGVTVSARAYYGPNGYGSFHGPVLTTTTDGDGHYSFAGVPSGDYTVSFHAVLGSVTHDFDDHLGDVAAGQSVTRDTIIYAKGSVSGTVTCAGCADGAAGPRNDMDLWLETRSSPTAPWTLMRQSSLDLDGRYAFSGLYPGDYRVTVFYTGLAGYARTSTRVVSLTEGALLVADPIPIAKYANAVTALYIDTGGASGPLGAAVGTMATVTTNGGGSVQNYAGGTIYSSTSGGTHVVWDDPIRQVYWAARSVYGTWGWPSSERSCGDDYCTQIFTGGQIYLTELGTLTAPVLTGTPIVGGSLSVSAGAYGPAATSYAYAWLRDGAVIAGATTAKYVLVQADLGHTLQARVTASAVGSMPAITLTAPTPLIGPSAQTKAPVPAISGTARVNTVLTASTGSWAAGTSWGYQWLAAGIPVAGATDPTFTPGPAQFGKTITVQVTGTHAAYSPTTRLSLPTAAVVASAFATAAVPTIVGTATVGAPLTVDTGAWSPAASFMYRWYAAGVAIAGAQSASFTPTGAQLAKAITVTVTGASPGYTTTARTSTATAPVGLGTYGATPEPTVTGTAAVGATLTADTTGWDAGSTFSYRWYSDGVVVPLATAKTYVPTPTQVGEVITVRITSTTVGYPVTVRESSVGSAPLTRGSFTTAPVPTITGAAKKGSTLTAVTAAWAPAATLAYQWFANGAPIIGAESATFVPTATQVGTTITVRVIGTKAGWTSTPRLSNPTAAVAP